MGEVPPAADVINNCPLDQAEHLVKIVYSKYMLGVRNLVGDIIYCQLDETDCTQSSMALGQAT